MKKIISAITAITLIGTMVFSVNASNDVETKKSYKEIFEKDKVIDVNININQEDIDDIFEYSANEEYHSATVTVDGITLSDVGIRTKGNISLSSVVNSDSDRYSFRLKFDKYVNGQTLLGLDDLCLNNQYSDASYMREYLHYEMLESLGIDTPETAFCNVYINGELFGFYLAVEPYTDTYLSEEYGDSYLDGNLYKMNQGSTLKYKEEENYSYADLNSGNDSELTDFKNFVKKLNEIPDGEKGDLESFLDVDSALKYIASNTVLCNYDSYNGNQHHNFYLYEDKNGIFTVLPWDFNMSFGGFSGANATVGIDKPIISGSMEELPLINKLLSVDEYKEKYYSYIQTLMQGLEAMPQRVSELKALISEDVKNDPSSFFTYEQFDAATTLSTNDTETTEAAAEDNTQKETIKRGGGMGNGTSSILKVAADRLENLKQQFSGEADKETEVSSGFGNHDKGGFGENPGGPQNGERPEGIRPPQNGETMNPMEGGGMFGGHSKPQGNENNQESKIRVNINGHITTFNIDPYITNERTLVEYRPIMESLGANIVWDEESQTITASNSDTVIVMSIGSDTAYVNGEAVMLDAAPEIKNDVTVIPVRFIAESLGMKVGYDDKTKLITITAKKK